MINACISRVIITLKRYFLIPKSRDLVSHNHGISGLKNGPGSRDPIPGSRPGIAIPNLGIGLGNAIARNRQQECVIRAISKLKSQYHDTAGINDDYAICRDVRKMLRMRYCIVAKFKECFGQKFKKSREIPEIVKFAKKIKTVRVPVTRNSHRQCGRFLRFSPRNSDIDACYNIFTL